jgi:putative DNA primase/helicase
MARRDPLDGPWDPELSLEVDRADITAEGKLLPDLRDERNRTDAGAARALVALHGDDLRHVHGAGWLWWSGRSWQYDRTGEVMARAKATADAMLRAAAFISDGSKAAAASFAVKAMSEPHLRAMVTLAASEPGIPILSDSLDSDPWLFNVQNGTIDLRTGRLLEHQRETLITKIAGCVFDPTAAAPLWLAFLNRIMDGRLELVDFLRRTCGYILTGSVREQVLFFLYGKGDNGKSSFIGMLHDLIGDYGRQAPSDVLLAKRNDSHPTGIAGLQGARLVSAIEVDEGRRLAEGIVKQMTGGDRIAARYMRQDFFEFSPTFKIALACNYKPVIRGTDLAIWRRIRLIPFDVTIPTEERDKDLPDKLRAELPGILAWAVRGCLEYQREGLRPPPDVLAATDAYRADSDVLGEFIAEKCITGTDEWATKDEMFRAYATWCEASGENPVSKRRFGDRLSERDGIADNRDHNRGRYWIGVSLKRESA